MRPVRELTVVAECFEFRVDDVDPKADSTLPWPASMVSN